MGAQLMLKNWSGTGSAITKVQRLIGYMAAYIQSLVYGLKAEQVKGRL